MNTFNINLDNRELSVIREEEDVFIVRIPEKTIYLLRKEDNEGANHWFEEGNDNETTLANKIGEAIEMYLQKNKI